MEMKTITQIAEEIGVSRQAVYNKIKKEPLSSTLQSFMSKVDSTLHFDINGEKLIKSAFEKEHLSSITVNDVDSTVKLLITTLQDQVTTLTTQNEDLRQQLSEERTDNREQLQKKDVYIKELTEKITDLTERLAVLFENSQQLQKNQQLLEVQNIIYDDVETENKKGFFKKIFKKSK